MKAALVIDMPENCSQCKLMYEFYGVKKCQILNILENGGKAIIPTEKLTTKRKDCCPLEPVLEVDEIRNKAIEEFAERLKNKLVVRYGNATLTKQYVAMQVDAWCNEIAESMKGEKE